MKIVENSNARLAVNQGLFAVALVLMCMGNRWLFFLGLALMLGSGLFSVRPCPHMGWLGWSGLLLLGATATAVFLWLSSCGREPLNPVIACVAGLGVAISELRYWWAIRHAPAHE